MPEFEFMGTTFSWIPIGTGRGRELVTGTPTGTVENKGRRTQGHLRSGERKQEENFTGKGIRSQESRLTRKSKVGPKVVLRG